MILFQVEFMIQNHDERYALLVVELMEKKKKKGKTKP